MPDATIINPRNRATLILRLRLRSLAERFPLCELGTRWVRVNLLFLLCVIPLALIVAYVAGYKLISYCQNLNELCSNEISSSLSNYAQYNWFAEWSFFEPEWLASLTLGIIYLIPMWLVCYIVCWLWNRLFILFFNANKDGGNLLLSLLFILFLPLTIPLGYAILGISFAIVFGKLLFGGHGHYLVSPALLGILFLSYSYPSLFTTDFNSLVSQNNIQSIWQLFGQATQQSVINGNHHWFDTLIVDHTRVASVASASAVASLVGLMIILSLRKEYWWLAFGAIVGLMLGTTLMSYASDNPIAEISWYWHLIIGNFAFCLAFIATDPTVLPTTQLARFLFALLFSFLTVTIRVATPTNPEGAITALLLASLLIPIIDWIVIQSHRKIKQQERSLKL